MSQADATLLYRASGSLVGAPVVRVQRADGRPVARAERSRSEDGRLGWAFRGGGVPDFVIEDEGDLDSFLVTRPDLAPFGRIQRLGRLRPRLEATDADGRQLVVEADGRVFDRADRELGHIRLTGPGEVHARLPALASPTRRSLVLAAPICHAAQQALARR
jgi:hypothetical protein